RVYFLNGSGTSQELYMREDDSTTYDVSASECTVNCGSNQSADDLVWANPTGDVALFVSCAKLTNDAAESKACGNGQNIQVGEGFKLYRWDENAAPGHHLTDLTVDHEPSDGTQPNVLDIVGASTNGGIVYLITGGDSFGANGGQLVSGASTASGMKLYRVRWNGGNPI